jgi:hypothetical protein
MPKPALEEGVPWSWRTFGEFLDLLRGRLGVNAGFRSATQHFAATSWVQHRSATKRRTRNSTP